MLPVTPNVGDPQKMANQYFALSAQFSGVVRAIFGAQPQTVG